MEGRSEWHNRMPSESQIAVARAELGLENCGIGVIDGCTGRGEP